MDESYYRDGGLIVGYFICLASENKKLIAACIINDEGKAGAIVTRNKWRCISKALFICVLSRSVFFF